MKNKTMRQVYEELGISRTTLQGWITGILDAPTGSDTSGWYFDEHDFELLWQIRFYKQLKYSNSKIKEILFDPQFDKKKSLDEQITLLTKQKAELEHLISVATFMRDYGVTPNAVRFALPEMEDASYEAVSTIMGSMCAAFDTYDESDFDLEYAFEGESGDKWFDAFDRIMELKKAGCDYDSDAVQLQVNAQYQISSESLTSSIIAFSWAGAMFYPGTELGEETDEMNGPGSAEFYSKAVQHFCIVHKDNEVDNEAMRAFDAIVELGRQKYKTTSDEVQAEVHNLHTFYKRIGARSRKAQLATLRNVSRLYNSQGMRDLIDNGAEHGYSWFIARSIEIYCDRLEHEITDSNK